MQNAAAGIIYCSSMSEVKGTSISSLKPRWRRCPYIFGRPQNAHLLRVNCAVHGCTNAAGAGAADFSAAHHIEGVLSAQLDRIYRGTLKILHFVVDDITG